MSWNCADLPAVIETGQKLERPGGEYALGMSNSSKAALAREVWVMMFDFLVRTAPQRAKSLGRRGLTPNDARAP